MTLSANKKERFTKHDIDTIFATIKYAKRGTKLDILLAPKTGGFGRLLVITRKKIGHAPARNRLRRQLRALFYEQKRAELPYDCVVIAKSTDVTFLYLQRMLDTAYKDCI